MWTTWAPSLSVPSVIPCVHWMSPHSCLELETKDSMEYVPFISIPDRHFHCLIGWPPNSRSLPRPYGTPKTFHSSNVEQKLQFRLSQWSQETTLHTKSEIPPIYPTKKARIVSTCKACPPHRSIIWKQSLVKRPVIPYPSKWGWE